MCYVIRILWVGEIHYSPLTSFYERRSPPVHLHRTVVRCYVDFLDLRTELNAFCGTFFFDTMNTFCYYGKSMKNIFNLSILR